jgi:hypothetical protein
VNIRGRLERAAQATGIDDPCEVRAATARMGRAVAEWRKARGISVGDGKSFVGVCWWCLRTHNTSAERFTAADVELFARMDEAHRLGRICAPENEGLYEQVIAACERSAREVSGEMYDEYACIVEGFRAELDAVTRHTIPRFHYLCRVAGCECEYPKTEAEYMQNVSYKLAR